MDYSSALEAVKNKIKNDSSENSYYKDLQYFNSQQKRYLEILKEVQGAKKILDIGCSPGHLTSAMSLMGSEVYGIDLQEQPWHEKTDAQISLMNVEKNTLPFPDSFFDAVVMTEIMEHFVTDPRRVLKEVLRVLKPEGRLILTTPNVANIGRTLKLVLGQNIYWSLDHFYEEDKSNAHVREYTKDEVRKMLEDSGFSCSKLRYVEYGGGTTTQERVRHICALSIKSLVPRFRGCILAVGKKSLK